MDLAAVTHPPSAAAAGVPGVDGEQGAALSPSMSCPLVSSLLLLSNTLQSHGCVCLVPEGLGVQGYKPWGP